MAPQQFVAEVDVVEKYECKSYSGETLNVATEYVTSRSKLSAAMAVELTML
jgi:hypothetical protein